MARIADKSDRRKVIDKANANVVVAVSATVFIVVFSLFSIKALVSQSLYNGKLITEKKKALSVLKDNEAAAKELEQVYSSFISEPTNVIGGITSGKGPKDGSNAKLILDALPAEYDFPAVSSSIEKILIDGGYSIASLGGQEDLITDDLGPTPAAGSESAVVILYPVSIRATASSTKKLIETLERSIRPFYVENLSLQGSSTSLDVKLLLKTFYLPSVGLQVNSKVVK